MEDTWQSPIHVVGWLFLFVIIIISTRTQEEEEEEEEKAKAMAASMMSSAPLSVGPARGLPKLRPFKVVASGVKKIKTDKPLGIGGGMNLRDGKDASGRKPTGKGVYQYVDKYGANVDGYSPIWNPDEWSPTGDVYAGGTTGLLIWAVTLAGILGGGALLVYSTSALAQ